MIKYIYIPASVALLTLSLSGCSEKTLSINDDNTVTSQETINVHELARELPVIFFPSGSTNLSMDAREQIRQVAVIMNHPDIIDQSISVDGHSDTLGDAQLNLTLSKQRADSVGRELVLNGVRHDRLIINAKGESQPLATETHYNGQQDLEASSLNRRVELFLVKSRSNSSQY